MLWGVGSWGTPGCCQSLLIAFGNRAMGKGLCCEMRWSGRGGGPSVPRVGGREVLIGSCVALLICAVCVYLLGTVGLLASAQLWAVFVKRIGADKYSTENDIIFYEILLKFISEGTLQWAVLLYSSCDFQARFDVGGSPGSGYPTGVWFSSLLCHPKKAAAHPSLLARVAIACLCVLGSRFWLFHRVSTARQQLHDKPAAWRKALLKLDSAQPRLAGEVGAVLMSLTGYTCTAVKLIGGKRDGRRHLEGSGMGACGLSRCLGWILQTVQSWAFSLVQSWALQVQVFAWLCWTTPLLQHVFSSQMCTLHLPLLLTISWNFFFFWFLWATVRWPRPEQGVWAELQGLWEGGWWGPLGKPAKTG